MEKLGSAEVRLPDPLEDLFQDNTSSLETRNGYQQTNAFSSHAVFALTPAEQMRCFQLLKSKIIDTDKLISKFQSKARALKQTQARLGELQASMKGLKEQLQLLLQEKNDLDVQLQEARSELQEMSGFRDMQEVYISQLKAQVEKLEQEKEDSLIISEGKEMEKNHLRDRVHKLEKKLKQVERELEMYRQMHPDGLWKRHRSSILRNKCLSNKLNSLPSLSPCQDSGGLSTSIDGEVLLQENGKGQPQLSDSMQSDSTLEDTSGGEENMESSEDESSVNLVSVSPRSSPSQALTAPCSLLSPHKSHSHGPTSMPTLTKPSEKCEQETAMFSSDTSDEDSSDDEADPLAMFMSELSPTMPANSTATTPVMLSCDQAPSSMTTVSPLPIKSIERQAKVTVPPTAEVPKKCEQGIAVFTSDSSDEDSSDDETNSLATIINRPPQLSPSLPESTAAAPVVLCDCSPSFMPVVSVPPVKSFEQEAEVVITSVCEKLSTSSCSSFSVTESSALEQHLEPKLLPHTVSNGTKDNVVIAIAKSVLGHQESDMIAQVPAPLSKSCQETIWSEFGSNTSQQGRATSVNCRKRCKSDLSVANKKHRLCSPLSAITVDSDCEQNGDGASQASTPTITDQNPTTVIVSSPLSAMTVDSDCEQNGDGGSRASTPTITNQNSTTVIVSTTSLHTSPMVESSIDHVARLPVVSSLTASCFTLPLPTTAVSSVDHCLGARHSPMSPGLASCSPTYVHSTVVSPCVVSVDSYSSLSQQTALAQGCSSVQPASSSTNHTETDTSSVNISTSDCSFFPFTSILPFGLCAISPLPPTPPRLTLISPLNPTPNSNVTSPLSPLLHSPFHDHCLAMPISPLPPSPGQDTPSSLSTAVTSCALSPKLPTFVAAVPLGVCAPTPCVGASGSPISPPVPLAASPPIRLSNNSLFSPVNIKKEFVCWPTSTTAANADVPNGHGCISSSNENVCNVARMECNGTIVSGKVIATSEITIGSPNDVKASILSVDAAIDSTDVTVLSVNGGGNAQDPSIMLSTATLVVSDVKGETVVTDSGYSHTKPGVIDGVPLDVSVEAIDIKAESTESSFGSTHNNGSSDAKPGVIDGVPLDVLVEDNDVRAKSMEIPTSFGFTHNTSSSDAKPVVIGVPLNVSAEANNIMAESMETSFGSTHNTDSSDVGREAKNVPLPGDGISDKYIPTPLNEVPSRDCPAGTVTSILISGSFDTGGPVAKGTDFIQLSVLPKDGLSAREDELLDLFGPDSPCSMDGSPLLSQETVRELAVGSQLEEEEDNELEEGEVIGSPPSSCLTGLPLPLDSLPSCSSPPPSQDSLPISPPLIPASQLSPLPCSPLPCSPAAYPGMQSSLPLCLSLPSVCSAMDVGYSPPTHFPPSSPMPNGRAGKEPAGRQQSQTKNKKPACLHPVTDGATGQQVKELSPSGTSCTSSSHSCSPSPLLAQLSPEFPMLATPSKQQGGGGVIPPVQRELLPHVRCPLPLPVWLASALVRIQKVQTHQVGRNAKRIPTVAMNRAKKQKPLNYIFACLMQLMLGGLHLETAIDMFSQTKNMSSSYIFALAIVRFLTEKYAPRLESVLELCWEKSHAVVSRTLDPLEHSYPPPLLKMECQLIVLVLHSWQLNHTMENLIPELLEALKNAILSTKLFNKIHTLSACCRMYAGLCRLQRRVEEIQFISCELLVKSFNLAHFPAIVALASVWPYALSYNTSAPQLFVRGKLQAQGVEYQPLSFTIEVVMADMVRKQKELKQKGPISNMKILCKWMMHPGATVQALTDSLISILCTSPHVLINTPPTGPSLRPQPSKHAYAIVMGLRVLASSQGWAWTNDTLIRTHLWPLLQKWNKQPSSVREATIVCTLRLMGFVAQQGLVHDPLSASIQQLQKVLISILQRSRNNSAVSLAIQFAAADALLDLCPPSHPNNVQVSSAISKWVTVLAQSSQTAHMAAEYGGKARAFQTITTTTR